MIICSAVNLSSVPDTINYQTITFQLKKDPVITDTKSVFGSEIRQSLHITFQIVRQSSDFPNNPLSNMYPDGLFGSPLN